MTFRLYLILMACVSLSAWIAWFVVLHAIDPTKSGFLGFFLFYSTFGMAFLSSITLLGTIVRLWQNKQEVVYRHVVRSLRQGILFTVLFLVALVLSSQGLLVWWAITLLILITAFTELIFLGISNNTRSDTTENSST